MSTRMDQKYKIIYNQINTIYKKELLSIPKACEKINIGTSTYYKICKALNKKSIAEINKKMDEKKKNKKLMVTQKGGNIYEKIDEKIELPLQTYMFDGLKTESLPRLPTINIETNENNIEINGNNLYTNNINHEQSNDNKQSIFGPIREELERNKKINESINKRKNAKRLQENR